MHIVNEIVNGIEKQDRRKLAAGENFYSLCHNCTHVINKIVNEIEKQNGRKLAAGENFFHTLVFDFQDCEPPSGVYFDFQDWGGVVKFTGCDLPPSGVCGNIPDSDPILTVILNLSLIATLFIK